MRHSKKGRLFLSAKRKKNRGRNFYKKSLPRATAINDQDPFLGTATNDQGTFLVTAINDQGPFPVMTINDQGPFPVTAKNDQGPFPVTAKNDQGPTPVKPRYSKKGRLYLSAKRKKNRGQNFYKKSLPRKKIEEAAAEAWRNKQNPSENEVILSDCGTTQALQFRANDTHMHLDANITVPYIKQEVIEPVVSQTLPCHTLSQEMVEPVISQTLPVACSSQTLPVASSSQTLPVASSSRKSKVTQNLPCYTLSQKIKESVISQTLPVVCSSQTLPVASSSQTLPVASSSRRSKVSQNLPCHTLSQKIKESVIPQTLPVACSSQTLPVASSLRKSKVINITKRILPQRSPIDLPYDAVCTERIDEPVPDFLPEKRQWIVKKKVLLSTGSRNGGSNNALAGKRFMTSGEANCTSNKLHKTLFTYLSSQRDQKPQLGQSIKNSFKTLLMKPAVQNVSSHTVLSGELIPPEEIKVKEEFEVAENEFHESPEAVISSLNQEKWNSSLSGSCLNPVTATIVRSPSTQWFMNSCTSAVTTETVTTFASTSGKTVCTSTSALSNTCLSSTSPILISSYAQPSIPRISYVSSLPINPALNGPMTLVPHWPAAISNSDLVFNSLLPTQNNHSPSMVTNLPFVANNLNNSSVPTRISDPSSNVNSSLPIQTVVLNQTNNSTLCDTNLIKVENVFTSFDKDDCLPDTNNATPSDVTIAQSDTKSTTLSGTKGTTMSDMNGTTLSDMKGTTLTDMKGTTLTGQNIISLSERISTTLCDRKSITLSDRSKAALSNRNNALSDRNSTALFDSFISNEPKQNTTGAPWTALSSNNSAQKQDSLTIAMPSDAARFASESVSNDEGSKEKMAFGKKAQYVLGEVADKLSKILPDISFVKYLTDPDFYFFIGLMPLIHMLSLQQKVQARIIIKGILYDLAYPANSSSLVTSN